MTDQNARNLALHAACEAGDIARAAALLAEGASVSWKDGGGRTALMIATQKNDLALAKALVDAGSDVNERDVTLLSPYLCSGANGFHELMALYLAHGADAKSVNRFGGTVLLPSSEKGYLKTVQVALKSGVPVNHANHLGWSALLEAVILGDGGYLYADIVSALVDAGADVHLQDRDGKSSLDHARALGQDRVVRILNREKGEPDGQAGAVAAARAKIFADDHAGALADLDTILAQDAKDPAAWYYKGYCLQSAKRLDEALAAYRQGLAGNPEQIEFYFYTANCMRLMKKPDEALAEYAQAVAARPAYPIYRYHMSNYLRELGRHAEAVAVMDTLLSYDPARYDYAFHKANSLRSLGQHEAAIVAIEIAIRSDATNPLYLLHKCQSLALLKRFDEALRVIEAAVRLVPEGADCLNERASVLIALGRRAEAGASIEKVLGKDPRNARAQALQASLA